MSKDKQITRAQPHHKFTGSGEDGGALPVQESIVSKKSCESFLHSRLERFLLGIHKIIYFLDS